jgi:Tol biopolymer transport system component
MRLLRLFCLIGALLLLSLTSSVWTARQESLDWTFVAWADGGENQGLIRVSLQDGIQATYPSSTIYNPDYVPSPDGMWLVYDRYHQGNSDIYRIRLHDGYTQNLTNSATNDTLDSWSPDGRWLLFWSQQDDFQVLKRMEWATGKVESLSQPVRNPVMSSVIHRLSPDGHTLFYVTNQANGYRLHVIPSDGEEISFQAGDTGPIDLRAWSPDSQWLIFRVQGLRLYRIHVGDKEVVAYHDIEAVTDVVSWSSDSRWLYFLSPQLDNSRALYRMQADGNQLQSVMNVNINNDVSIWSPDGDWFYHKEWTADNAVELLRTQADGAMSETVTTGLTMVSNLFWSPDNEWLYFDTFEDGLRLYRMRPDGSEKQLVIQSFRTDPIISPDGAWILYTDRVQLNDELFRVQSDGTHGKRLTFSNGRFVDLSFEGWLEVPEKTWEPFFLCILGVGGIGLATVVRKFDKRLGNDTI